MRAPLAGESGHLHCTGCERPHWSNPIPVAGILLVRDGRILLTRRSEEMSQGAGRWAFPGGFVESGETTEEAAVRETREEANVDATITGIVGMPHSMVAARHLVTVYRGEADGEPQPGPEVEGMPDDRREARRQSLARCQPRPRTAVTAAVAWRPAGEGRTGTVVASRARHRSG